MGVAHRERRNFPSVDRAAGKTKKWHWKEEDYRRNERANRGNDKENEIAGKVMSEKGIKWKGTAFLLPRGSMAGVKHDGVARPFEGSRGGNSRGGIMKFQNKGIPNTKSSLDSLRIHPRIRRRPRNSPTSTTYAAYLKLASAASKQMARGQFNTAHQSR